MRAVAFHSTRDWQSRQTSERSRRTDHWVMSSSVGSSELGFPASPVLAFDQATHSRQITCGEVLGIPVDSFTEADGEVHRQHHFGEGTGLVFETGNRLGPLATDGTAEFLGGAAFDALEDFRDGPGFLHEGFREEDRGRAAIGVVEEYDALAADEDLAELGVELDVDG